MKNVLILIAFILSTHASAHMVHKSGQGTAPTASRAKIARQCFEEATASGCRKPSDDRREFRACVRNNLETFSSDCRTFLSRKYGRRT